MLNSLEMITMEVLKPKAKSFLINAWYRPPHLMVHHQTCGCVGACYESLQSLYRGKVMYNAIRRTKLTEQKIRNLREVPPP